MKLKDILLGFLLVSAITSCGELGINSPPATNRTETQGNTSSNFNSVTMSQYNQITEGMTVGQVTAILGTQKNIQELNGKQTYIWLNSDYSGISLMFDKGILITKVQSGLK